jgi:hypothetical protein
MRDVPVQPLSVQDESRLAPLDAGYLAQIRLVTSRLGRRGRVDDAREALVDLGDVTVIDTDVPTVSPRRRVRFVKRQVKALIGWYLRYLAQQTTVLGQATARLGTALVDQADRLEGTTTGLAAELARLQERVERLEGIEGSDRVQGLDRSQELDRVQGLGGGREPGPDEGGAR